MPRQRILPPLALLILNGCAFSVQPGSLENTEAAFRRLPGLPMRYDRIQAQQSGDWRQLEGWTLDGLRIEQFDRVSALDGSRATWAELTLDGGEPIQVVCRSELWGDPTSAAGDAATAAMTACFVEDGLLVLVGRAPWGSRAGLWVDENGRLDIITHHTATDNWAAFNAERTTVYRADEPDPLGYLDHRRAVLRPDLGREERRLLVKIAAVMQTNMPHRNQDYPPGRGEPLFEREVLSNLGGLLAGAALPPADNSEMARLRPVWVSALEEVGLGAVAQRLAPMRGALEQDRTDFESLTQDRSVRMTFGLRGVFANGQWDAWAPDGNDGADVFFGFDINGGVVLFERLQMTVGVGIMGDPFDNDAFPDLGLAQADGGAAFGFTGDAVFRLGEWDDLDIFYFGASGRWMPLAVVTYEDVAQRNFDMAAVGPTVGFESCAATEYRMHFCLHTELSAMATWIYSDSVDALGETNQADLVEMLQQAARTDQGWAFELRFGIRFGY